MMTMMVDTVEVEVVEADSVTSLFSQKYRLFQTQY